MNFLASSESIKLGDSVVLTWDSKTMNAKKCTLSGGVYENTFVPISGTMSVTPNQTEVYMLSCFNGVNVKVENVAVVVRGADNKAIVNPLAVLSLNPDRIPSNLKRTFLAWTSYKVYSCEVSGGEFQEQKVTPNSVGFLFVSPKVDTTYFLSCFTDDGKLISKSARVYVSDSSAYVLPKIYLLQSIQDRTLSIGQTTAVRWRTVGEVSGLKMALYLDTESDCNSGICAKSLGIIDNTPIEQGFYYFKVPNYVGDVSGESVPLLPNHYYLRISLFDPSKNNLVVAEDKRYIKIEGAANSDALNLFRVLDFKGNINVVNFGKVSSRQVVLNINNQNGSGCQKTGTLDWGDGSSDTYNTEFAFTPCNLIVNHTYASPGTYWVKQYINNILFGAAQVYVK
jgi:hypothetical protein